MREWLTVIVVLLIAGILLDGLRRMRLAQRQRIKMSRQVAAQDALTDPVEPEVALSSEFPSGGARVAAYRDDNDAEHILQNVRQKHVRSKQTRGVRNRDGEAPAVGDNLPNLMNAFVKRTQPRADDEPLVGTLKNIEQLQGLEPELAPVKAAVEPARAPSKPAVATAVKNAGPQEVIVLNIMAPQGERFYGNELLPLLMELQLRFGDMDIFHRHSQNDGTGPVLFSLANMVKPGTFELSSMTEFETPGLSLFMTLPAGEDSMHAFALMAQAAKRLTQELRGELKDETRSAMTQQTFEHYKQRVAEFERKRRLAKA